MMEFLKKYSVLLLISAVVLGILGRYLYKTPNVINGEAAPNIVGTRLDGMPFDLSSLRGKYVLLDFWGSWCGPCLAEAPELRTVVAGLKNRKFSKATGFEAVGVGIERDRTRWEMTIQSLKTTDWIHISDFQNLDSPIAKAYGVRVIPTKFLLNTEGVIMAVNPTIQDMERLLE
jgi:thiol-disulfide isomerase/thioredoxin